MEFLVLGAVEVLDDGRPLPIGGPKQRAVLAHLILQPNRIVPAEQLIEDLWGEEPPDTARNTLQSYVSRLRKLLGDGRIEGRGGGYVLSVAPEEIDASRFEALVRQGKASAESYPSRAAAAFAEALDLWRGPAFADLADELSLRGSIARMDELRLGATEHRIAAELAMGRHSTMVSELEALTSQYPLRERLWAHLMLAMYRSGRQAEALDAFQRARQVLQEELGADPSAELLDLNQRILMRDPELFGDKTSAPPPSARPSRGDLEPGTSFAGYRIEAVLGRGGMSVVYLAEHLALGRKVALKLLAPQLAEDDRFRERFVRESRVAAGMEHPNIVPIYEAGEAEGSLFIAMRYVPGTDLGKLIRREGVLDAERALWIVRETASALDAAHSRGLVHRDVKPGNILVVPEEGSEGRDLVYLSDFGLTKRLEGGPSGLTQTGQFVGTVDYVAPEQIEGKRVDARADVYALACVLFECLTGKVPYERETQVAALYAHLGEKPPRLTASRPDFPAAIDEVVATALSKSPDGRYVSCGRFTTAARDALGPPAGPTGRASWLGWRAVAGALAAAIVTGVIVFSVSRGEPPAGQSGEDTAASPAAEPHFGTVERAITPDEERLLGYIPEDLGASCLPLAGSASGEGPLAALVCMDDEVEVLYEQFSTRDEMDEAFQTRANVNRAPGGECASDHLAVTPYSIGGELAGRVLCYTLVIGETETSHIQWTDENSATYAHAIRNDQADLTLYEWWLSSSGPVASAEDATVTAKDRPAAATVPLLRDGSYLVSAAEPDRVTGVNLRDANGRPLVTYRMHIEDGTYEFARDAAIMESGNVLLAKPDLVVFDPLTGDCVGTGLTGGPASYRVSGSAKSLNWEFKSGGTCAGPKEVSERLAWTPAPSGVIAFATEGQIALMDAAGFDVEQLTDESRSSASPGWSPDGTRIVFTDHGPDGSDLYAMHADGTGLVRLTDVVGDVIDPAWSPDGSHVALALEEPDLPDSVRSSVVVMDSDGSGWTELVTSESEGFGWPAWSPDGRRIAFTGINGDHFNLYVMGAGGSDVTKVGEEPAGHFGFPLSWTPDGERILFWGHKLGGGRTILSMRPDGSDVREFMEDFPRSPYIGQLVLDWSPDGRWIVMAGASASDSSGTLALLMRADASEVFTIGAYVTEPTWRPVSD
ncbi:MAG: BTAD domain-containing putative transcriptional regulator [Actinomycetota bacterium]